MKDNLTAQLAALTAEQQETRAAVLDTATKREKLALLQGQINALLAVRRAHQAQRVNGISPMEQRGRRY